MLLGNFKEIGDELRNFEKKNQERIEKICRKFYIIFGESLQKICEISKFISRTFKNKNFKIIKSRPCTNHRDQYFEKIKKKKNLIKFYKKFEELSQKFRKNLVEFTFT